MPDYEERINKLLGDNMSKNATINTNSGPRGNGELANLQYLSIDTKKLYQDSHYSQAVFEAFKSVEILVRDVSGLGKLYGVDLMRKAFDKNNGPLCNKRLSSDEQENAPHLFAGAMGFIRNPKGHNAMETSKDKALELLYFANYLLRVVHESKETSKGIRSLKLSTRLTNILLNNNVKTFEDISKLTKRDFSRMWGMGRKAIEEIEALLATKGLSLKEEE